LIENQKVIGSNPIFESLYFCLMKHSFLLDSSTSWQLYFQDAATPVMEGIINLHHDLMFFITFIFFFVLVVMARTLYFFQKTSESVNSSSRFVVHGTAIEII
jgi:cytochrome c oxidase subunit 2|tara:strand:- start:997 stop:1302 length:306 start_codon:yes stop_codon:yes gene_type:complete